MENKPKLNTVLLIIIIFLLMVGLVYVYISNNSKPKSLDYGFSEEYQSQEEDYQNNNPLVESTPTKTSTQVPPSTVTPTAPVTNSNTPPASPAQPTPSAALAATTIWKTYINTKYGFSFKYPNTWSKNGDDVNVSDLSGKITAVEINFKDTKSKNTLVVAYHLPPNGAALYQGLLSDYNSSSGFYASSKNKLQVAGNNAIEGYITYTVDGRGNKLNPPLQKVVVDFLDDNNGEFQFQFTTFGVDNKEQVNMFNSMLASFQLDS